MIFTDLNTNVEVFRFLQQIKLPLLGQFRLDHYITMELYTFIHTGVNFKSERTSSK